MTPKDLADYAINTSEFYDTHILLIKNNRPFVDWQYHVKVRILSKYKREMHEPFEGMSLDDIDTTANILIEYYVDHVKEMQSDLTCPLFKVMGNVNQIITSETEKGKANGL